MIKEKVLETDVWIKPKIDNIWQGSLVDILRDFVDAGPYDIDFRDRVPLFDKSIDTRFLAHSRIYKAEIFGPARRDIHDIAAAQFIIDSEKIILRAFYPLRDFSIRQREKIADEFLDYLIEKGIDIENN